MVEALDDIDVAPPHLVIHPAPEWPTSDEALFHFCARNRGLRIERTRSGDIVIMTPESGGSGSGGALLTYYFVEWARRDGTGTVFNSSAGFVLPNIAMRSPDVAWVLNERLNELSAQEWDRFVPLCPDFVLELRSPSDRLPELQAKMAEYIANGAQLAWLLDPKRRQVHVYRPKAEPEILNDPSGVSGEPLLRGFTLDVKAVWEQVNPRSR